MQLIDGFSKLSKIEKDVDRDYWMTAEEAVKYGIVDKVIS